MAKESEASEYVREIGIGSFLRAEDLKKPTRAEIVDEPYVQDGQFGKKLIVPIKLGKDEEKLWQPNKRATRALANERGPDPAKWVGTKFTLSQEEIESGPYKGKITIGLEF